MVTSSKLKLNKSLQEKLDEFKKCTDKVIDVLVYSQQEAQKHNCKYVSNSHILLGLLTDEYCYANHLLKKQGVTVSVTRDILERQWDPKEFKKIELSGFTQFAMATFKTAQEFCDELGNTYIGTEHLLYGMINEEQRGCLTYHILTDPFGLTSKDTEKQIREFLSGD